MLDFLKVYTAMGWAVHPLNAKSKAPLLRGWQALATTDMAQVAEWAKQFPGCALGTPTRAERAVLLAENAQDAPPRRSDTLGGFRVAVAGHRPLSHNTPA